MRIKTFSSLALVLTVFLTYSIFNPSTVPGQAVGFEEELPASWTINADVIEHTAVGDDEVLENYGTINYATMTGGLVDNAGRIEAMIYFGGSYQGWIENEMEDVNLGTIGTLIVAGEWNAGENWGIIENLIFADSGMGLLVISAFDTPDGIVFDEIGAQNIDFTNGNVLLDLSGLGNVSNDTLPFFFDGVSFADVVSGATIGGTPHYFSVTTDGANAFPIIADGMIQEGWSIDSAMGMLRGSDNAGNFNIGESEGLFSYFTDMLSFAGLIDGSVSDAVVDSSDFMPIVPATTGHWGTVTSPRTDSARFSHDGVPAWLGGNPDNSRSGSFTFTLAHSGSGYIELFMDTDWFGNLGNIHQSSSFVSLNGNRHQITEDPGFGMEWSTYTIRIPFNNINAGQHTVDWHVRLSAWGSMNYSLTVNPPVAPPIITGQPVSATYIKGDWWAEPLTVTASKEGGDHYPGTLSYQWFYWDGSDWIPISGATSSSFIPPTSTMEVGTYLYRCRVTNTREDGRALSLNSQNASIRINQPPPLPLPATPTLVSAGPYRDHYYEGDAFTWTIGAGLQWQIEQGDLSNLTGFEIHYKKSNESWEASTKKVLVPSAHLRSTIVRGLVPGTAYDFRVVAINSAGSSLPSAERQVVTPAFAALHDNDELFTRSGERVTKKWEYLTKHWVVNSNYNVQRQEGNLVTYSSHEMTTGFVIDKIFSGYGTGFYAAGLIRKVEGQPTEAILVFRGTNGVLDVFSDFHTNGVGYNQYSAARADILNWITNGSARGADLSLTGHSLGGALVQWFAVDISHTQGVRLVEVETFNSPGIGMIGVSGPRADAFIPGNTKVRHHIVNGDFVSLAGLKFIAGTNYFYDVGVGEFWRRHLWQFRNLDIKRIETISSDRLNAGNFGFTDGHAILQAIPAAGIVTGLALWSYGPFHPVTWAGATMYTRAGMEVLRAYNYDSIFLSIILEDANAIIDTSGTDTGKNIVSSAGDWTIPFVLQDGESTWVTVETRINVGDQIKIIAIQVIIADGVEEEVALKGLKKVENVFWHQSSRAFAFAMASNVEPEIGEYLLILEFDGIPGENHKGTIILSCGTRMTEESMLDDDRFMLVNELQSDTLRAYYIREALSEISQWSFEVENITGMVAPSLYEFVPPLEVEMESITETSGTFIFQIDSATATPDAVVTVYLNGSNENFGGLPVYTTTLGNLGLLVYTTTLGNLMQNGWKPEGISCGTYHVYIRVECGDAVPEMIYFEEEIAIHGYQVSRIIEATCVKEGYTVYTCECGASYEGDHHAPLGHNWVPVKTPPTYTEKGYTTYTCSNCGDEYVDEIDTLVCPEEEYRNTLANLTTAMAHFQRINPRAPQITVLQTAVNSATSIIRNTGNFYAAIDVLEDALVRVGYYD